jgi:D-arabinose 1-dehydrogenase-like Zn-dependent alcohol dehydrogenase
MTATAAWGATAPDSGLNPLSIDRRTLRDEDVAIDIAYCGVCHSDLHVAEAPIRSSLVMKSSARSVRSERG